MSSGGTVAVLAALPRPLPYQVGANRLRVLTESAKQSTIVHCD